MVKEQTGHDKVTFLPVSLGGTILTAYLEKYGHEDLDQIVNAVACLDGTDIVADFMAREWRLEDEYLYHQFFANIFVESEGVPTIGYLINTENTCYSVIRSARKTNHLIIWTKNTKQCNGQSVCTRSKTVSDKRILCAHTVG